MDNLILVFFYDLFVSTIKLIFKAFWICGFRWVMIPGILSGVLSFGGVSSSSGVIQLLDILINIGFILVPFELIQNIYRYIKQDKTFNIYLYIINFFLGKRKNILSKVEK